MGCGDAFQSMHDWNVSIICIAQGSLDAPAPCPPPPSPQVSSTEEDRQALVPQVLHCFQGWLGQSSIKHCRGCAGKSIGRSIGNMFWIFVRFAEIELLILCEHDFVHCL